MKQQIDRAAVDARIRKCLDEGRLRDGATEALKSYGPEMYALFASIHRSDTDAGEVFSLFCEQLWKGLGGFEGRSSFRTWAYTIAWHASARFRDQQRTRREVLVRDSEFLRLAENVRTSTHSRLRREKRSRLRELRETLPAEDQMLLILRVERELDWKDLARVINDSAELDDDELDRESARLRKRFQAVKDRLRELARNDSG